MDPSPGDEVTWIFQLTTSQDRSVHFPHPSSPFLYGDCLILTWRILGITMGRKGLKLLGPVLITIFNKCFLYCLHPSQPPTCLERASEITSSKPFILPARKARPSDRPKAGTSFLAYFTLEGEEKPSSGTVSYKSPAESGGDQDENLGFYSD